MGSERARVRLAAALGAPLVLVAGVASAKPPIWDRTIDGAKRFKVLKAFDGEAVLDQETGLVWDRAPGGAPRSWAAAIAYCYGRIPGDRLGWRLPRIEEVLSLVDPTPSRGACGAASRSTGSRQ